MQSSWVLEQWVRTSPLTRGSLNCFRNLAYPLTHVHVLAHPLSARLLFEALLPQLAMCGIHTNRKVQLVTG